MQIHIAEPSRKNDFIQISSLSAFANNGNGIFRSRGRKTSGERGKKLLNFMNRKLFFCVVSSFVDNKDNFNGNQCPLL